MSERLDAAMVRRELCGGRDRAKEWIVGGAVCVNGKVVTKPAFPVEETDEIACLVSSAFVGRGGEKLEKALTLWQPALTDCIAADIGASTGGFTDCLLRHGAAKVYAVDIGHGQLHPSLLADSRVRSLEGMDVRNRTALSAVIPDKSVDFLCADVSFISLRQIWDSASALLKDSGCAVCLIKPQFEAGRSAVGKRGIVRDAAVHKRVLRELCAYFSAGAWQPQALTYSPICGGDGNIEYLVLLEQRPTALPDVEAAVATAFSELHRKG